MADDGRMKLLAVTIALMLGTSIALADDKATFAALEKQLSGTKFTGVFTIDGKEGAPVKEEYTLLNVKKFGDGDLFIFRARVKYGKTDVTLSRSSRARTPPALRTTRPSHRAADFAAGSHVSEHRLRTLCFRSSPPAGPYTAQAT